MNKTYYNDNDPSCCSWLRELIKTGLIPDGEVDERSIADVRPEELRGFGQCHFFAGIGGWTYALKLAEWPDDRPVWTGSVPCQPWSAAGKRKGTADARHLWPEFYRLIGECRPPVVFGEQVEAAIRLGWLDGVFTDLERAGYACGAAVLPAACVGAPHIRHRIWWVADAECVDGRLPDEQRAEVHEIKRGGTVGGLADATPEQFYGGGNTGARRWDESANSGNTRGLANANGSDQHRRAPSGEQPIRDEVQGLGGLDNPKGAGTVPAQQQRQRDGTEQASPDGGLGHADFAGSQGRGLPGCECAGERSVGAAMPWSDFDLIPCRDGKARRVEPGTFPLADGVPARVGRLRGYGNAIVPQVAAEFVRAYMEITKHQKGHQ